MPVTASVVRYPFPYEPVNTNGMWFGLSSTQSSLTDFKYIFNLYTYNNTSWGTASGTSSDVYYMGSFKVPPDISSGNGYYTPHRGLKSKYNNRLLYGVINASATQSTLLHYNNSPIKYKLDYGLEWNPLTVISSIKTVSPFANIQLFFTGSQDLAVGDIIRVNKTNPQFDAYINSFATILSTTFSSPTFSCMLDMSAVGGGLKFPNDTGRIIYQKRMISSLTQSNLSTNVNGTNGAYTDLYAIDAVRDLESPYTKKVIGTFKDSFLLTNLKDRRIFLNQYDSFSILSDGTTPGGADKIDNIYIQLVNSAGSIYQTYTYSTYYNTYIAAYPNARAWTIACGTAEVAQITGNNLSLASSYNIIPYCSANGFSMSVSRQIVENCSPYDNVRLAWLNKLGGWDFFNFNMISKMNSTISRSEFRKALPFDYNVNNMLGTRQSNYLGINSSEIYQVSSDWVTETEYNLLQELVESPEVYVVNGLTYSGAGNIILVTTQALPNPQLTPIMITTTSYSQKKTINDAIFNMTIEYKKAYDKINHNR